MVLLAPPQQMTVPRSSGDRTCGAIREGTKARGQRGPRGLTGSLDSRGKKVSNASTGLLAWGFQGAGHASLGGVSALCTRQGPTEHQVLVWATWRSPQPRGSGEARLSLCSGDTTGQLCAKALLDTV